MEEIDSTRVVQQCNSLYARIPASIAKLLGIVKGTTLKISKDGKKIIYEREV